MKNLTEHRLQANIAIYLRKNGITTVDSDVMAALRYLSPKDKRRILFINQHKSMGYTNGQPDLVLLLPKSGEVVFVELKNGLNGVVSKEQKSFRDWCLDNGHNYLIWRSLRDAEDFVKGV